MPKQKTHKGLSKRIRVTATGKVKHRRTGRSHLMSGKDAKRRRGLRGSVALTGAAANKFKTELCK